MSKFYPDSDTNSDPLTEESQLSLAPDGNGIEKILYSFEKVASIGIPQITRQKLINNCRTPTMKTFKVKRNIVALKKTI